MSNRVKEPMEMTPGRHTAAHARAGDVVWNPLTGEKALLVESAEETAGARIVSDFAVEEGGFVPGGGEHVHDYITELFEVLEGRMTFAVNGEERTLGPGEQLTVPPGVPQRGGTQGKVMYGPGRA